MLGSGAEAPERRVGAECTTHILVYLDLEIDSELSVGPDHDVGADANRRGDVAPGVGDPAIRAVIGDAGLGLL